jgi:hypothetical protein
VRKIFQDKGSRNYGQTANRERPGPKPATAQQAPGLARQGGGGEELAARALRTVIPKSRDSLNLSRISRSTMIMMLGVVLGGWGSLVWRASALDDP